MLNYLKLWIIQILIYLLTYMFFKNNKYMKKNITPIMVICNEDKFPLCFSVLNESNKNNINNKKINIMNMKLNM